MCVLTSLIIHNKKIQLKTKTNLDVPYSMNLENIRDNILFVYFQFCQERSTPTVKRVLSSMDALKNY